MEDVSDVKLPALHVLMREVAQNVYNHCIYCKTDNVTLSVMIISILVMVNAYVMRDILHILLICKIKSVCNVH